jgi:hypothetical protein
MPPLRKTRLSLRRRSPGSSYDASSSLSESCGSNSGTATS